MNWVNTKAATRRSVTTSRSWQDYDGRNVLAVHVNPRPYEGWWYEGGGIYRHVWLNIANPVHVEPWGVFVTSDLPEPGPDSAAPQATLHIQTTVTNAGAAAVEAELVSRVVDDRGTGVAKLSSRAQSSSGRAAGDCAAGHGAEPAFVVARNAPALPLGDLRAAEWTNR